MTDVKPIPDTYPRVTPHSRCGHGAAELDGEDAPLLGRRVAIYGGGNTALDAARTARRAGSAPPDPVEKLRLDESGFPQPTGEFGWGPSTRSSAGWTSRRRFFEARRCLSCGNCFECDNCYGVCPDNAIIKLGPGRRYEIDDDFCKGCSLCVAECPAGAISVVPERT